MAKVIHLESTSTGGGTSGVGFKYVAQSFTDLNAIAPQPIAIGTLAYVANSQGTAWLPGTIGGNYYSNGIYISDGSVWISDRNAIAEQLQINIDDINDLELSIANLSSDDISDNSVLATASVTIAINELASAIANSKLPYNRITSTYTGNINTTTATVIPFDVLELSDPTAVTSDGIGFVLQRDSAVLLYSKVAFQSNGVGNPTRMKLSLQWEINGLIVGEKSHDSYLRNNGGAVTTETKLRYYFPNLAAGTTIRITAVRNSNTSGGAELITQDCFIECLLQDPVSISAPDILTPLDGSTVAFINGVISSFQSTIQGLANIWTITNAPNGVTIDNGGKISYDGTTPVGITNNVIIEAANIDGSDSVTINIEITLNPFLLTGYAGHYNTENLLLNENDPISIISDITGNNRDVLQNTLSFQPLYIGNSNGFPAAKFDGLDDQMKTNAFFQASVTQTMFIVLSSTSIDFNKVVMAFGDGNNKGNVILNDSNLGSLGGTFNGSTTSLTALSGVINDGNIHLLTVSSTGIQTTLSIDKVNTVTFNNSVAGINITDFNIGSLANGGNFASFIFHECVYYTTTPTPSEIASIEDLIISKYGI